MLELALTITHSSKLNFKRFLTNFICGVVLLRLHEFIICPFKNTNFFPFFFAKLELLAYHEHIG